MNLIRDYMDFLDYGKTERRCVTESVKLAEKKGYRNIEDVDSLVPGDKVYVNKMGKSLVLFNIGKEDITKGMNILGAHIDSPRLDVKQNPLYERDGLVYFNTHYYGGIKKYQWLAMPLAINGFVFLSDGTEIDVNIGDSEDDPVFTISDILPHIAQDQMKKPASEFIDAENLDVIVGSFRTDTDSSDKKKENTKAQDCDDSEKKTSLKDRVMKLISEKYGFKEDDFLSSELEIVPAGKARFLGFDKNLILAYGQDDRVCAYTSLAAMLETDDVTRTTCCILTDKEEIGSVGATGMNSHLLDNSTAEVVFRLCASGACRISSSDIAVRRTLSNSTMLSSDVNAAFDPLNPGLYDKQNSSFLGKGVVFNKFTGSRGKAGASDANPEFIASIRGKLDKAGVKFQVSELAKVDVGGGGTIAKFAAEFGMSVIDCGVSVLSMHAPWEITSTFDVESAYECYKAFLAE